MQFRLVHLFVATAIVAVGLMAADRYLYHSVLVEFTTMEVPPESIQILNDPDYALNFTIHYNQYPVNGTVGDSFGYNSILDFDVDSNNVAKLDGRTIRLKFRKHSFPWLPATRIEDQIELHFDELIAFSNIEEWRAEGRRR